MTKNYEIIEHTADIGIRVKGRTLAELFINAASALFDIIAEKKTNTRSRPASIRIQQTADSQEELLKNWLNELLFLSQTKELIFTDFKIDELTPAAIKARGIGSAAQDFRINVEVKAATFHQLKIEKADNAWQAEIIFDV